MSQKIYCILTLILFVCANCSRRTIPTKSKEVSIHKMITLSKSSCFGKCQVYTISLYTDGLLILESKENMEKLGVFHSSIDAIQLDKFNRKINSINWKLYKPKFMKNIPDLPVTTLSYFNLEDSSTTIIQSNSSLPNELEAIHKDLSDLSKANIWILAMKDKEINSPDIIKNELQVDMDSTLKYEYLEEIFQKYDFKMDKRISQYMNYYLFKFDQKKISPVEMVVLCRRIKGVRLVNFNRKLKERDEF